MNVYRRSGSQDAVVSLEWDSRHIAVEVQDFGCGIPTAILEGRRDDAAQPGVGLPGMRCRVEQLGGSLEVRSDEKGIRVRAILPSVIPRG
jgi:two-component system NarL family sensor kinase